MVRVANGSNVTSYEASTVAFGSTCSSESRSCSNRTLSGTYTNSSCSVAAAANCSFNGQTVAHGSNVTAYQTASVAFGSSCTSESRSCSNGNLSWTYANSSCFVGAAASCSFGGQAVAHGSNVTGYQASSVNFGSTCTSESRSCSNGTLSGSYANLNCNVLPQVGTTWTRVTQYAAPQIQDHTSLVYDNKMWIIGGSSIDGGWGSQAVYSSH